MSQDSVFVVIHLMYQQLTQISACVTHKNLAVRIITEAMLTVYVKNGTTCRSTHLKQNMTQTITEHTRVCERKACIVCKVHFILLNHFDGAFVSVSFRWCAFLNFCTHISRPLGYGVRISSNASVTADVLRMYCTYQFQGS